MSTITNIILTTRMHPEQAAIDEINAWLAEREDPPLFDATAARREARQGWLVEATVLIGAYNRFDLIGFLTAVRMAPWGADLEDVRVYVEEQDEEAFRERLHTKAGAAGEER